MWVDFDGILRTVN